jgi:prevent-host-death family protein
MSSWQLQDAKARFSEVIRKAETEGPQRITVRGEPAAVVLSEADYEQLVGAGESLVDFMRRSPLYGQEDIGFARDKSLTRKVEL